ncbi:hypothetical protein [Litorimonas sp.]|jgi:hypothetical protein|uniref:hypothetical protein n=1 Tax=Litorimonas sp. TaxID=1892381 RepID=UPI003A85E629
MKLFIHLFSVVVMISILSACSTPRSALEGQTDNFGSSNRTNILAHSVTPDPKLKSDTYIPADRERVRAAREAYQKGEVKELKPVQLQSD